MQKNNEQNAATAAIKTPEPSQTGAAAPAAPIPANGDVGAKVVAAKTDAGPTSQQQKSQPAEEPVKAGH